MQHSTEGRPAFLAHHFDTPVQQFRTGKLGMWLFLATEILMFSGLFCAYAVYRHNHPEIFYRASQMLNWKLGALNTLILICSSMTMAWAVHAAQTGQQKRLVTMLGLTLLCACGFLAVKVVEYHDKWKHHLLPGTNFRPHEAAEVEKGATKQADGETGGRGDGEKQTGGGKQEAGGTSEEKASSQEPRAKSEEPHPNPKSENQNPKPDAKAEPKEWTGPVPGAAPRGLAKSGSAIESDAEGRLPRYTHIFFGIYFTMTGLHGIHVLVGMGVISWLLLRARRGEFSPEYNAPVDLVGLYWHLVDIIWIYLFPLLYLVR
ncbi:MAG TPA: cytochrome c oxidase subunit 3 [Planctomycetota bacterium]